MIDSIVCVVRHFANNSTACVDVGLARAVMPPHASRRLNAPFRYPVRHRWLPVSAGATPPKMACGSRAER
jgi:hypothetical protein